MEDSKTRVPSGGLSFFKPELPDSAGSGKGLRELRSLYPHSKANWRSSLLAGVGDEHLELHARLTMLRVPVEESSCCERCSSY